MKLKYIFTALVAAFALAVGCEDDIERYLDEVKVSSSYVAIPAAGGSQTITVNATADWSFGKIPEWVEVSPASGAAGKTEVTFKAGAATETNEAMLYLNCEGKSQIINVLQMTEKVDLPITPLKEFLAAEVGPTIYRIAGTITKIEEISASYKNATLTISDDEGYSVYLYRFGPPSGTKIEDLGMEVGDFLTVEGQRGDYKGSPQMAAGGVFVSLVKSLIKVDSVTVKVPGSEEFKLYSEPLPLEGAELKAHLTVKGNGISVVVPDDAKSWLSVTSIETSGTNATVTFNAANNAGGDRSTTLEFNTTSSGKSYSAQTTLEQKGAIIETTVDKILAAEDGDTQYRVTGYISKMANTTYGNYNIKDATGEIYVYGTLNNGESKKFEALGINEGDIVTIVGPKTSYNGKAQLKNVTVEVHKAVKDITAAEFVAKDDDKTTYYRLTGTVSGIKESDVYGNFDLTDASGKVYVYGLLKGWGGASKQFQSLGIKDGDIVTLVGCVGSYKGNKQVVNAFYVSHETGGGEDPQPGENPYSIDLKYSLGANAYDDNVATVNGTENVKFLKIGASKGKVGDLTITVPAGSKKVSFYALAWKGAPTTLEFSGMGSVLKTLDIKANDGVAGNSDFKFTVAESDCYTFDIPIELTSDLDVKVTTAASVGNNTRAVLFGIKASK